MLKTACDIGRVPTELTQQFRLRTDLDFSQLDQFWWLNKKNPARSGPENAPHVQNVRPATPDEVLPLRETEEDVESRIREFVVMLKERPEQHIVVVGHSSFFKRMLAMNRKLHNCELYETSFQHVQLRYLQKEAQPMT